MHLVNRRSSRARKPAIASLRDRQREAVTTALLDAAEAVIAEQGLAGAGMAEIARRAGVAVGTLYNYFPDREGLVRALLDTRRNAFVPRIRGLLGDASVPFEPRLRAFIRDVLGLFDEHRQFIRIGFEIDPPLAMRGKSRAVVDTMRGCLRELLVAGVAEGVLRDEHLDLRVRLLGSSIRAVLVHEVEHGGAFTRDADAIVDLFLHGARA
jgi:AcrR family transcriptional regulator